MSRWYITTALPYVNAPPHLGHALELVQGDALARSRRQAGDDVRLIGGTDDHALKNVLAAEVAGVSVADHVAANARAFEELAHALGVAFDDFISTSRDPRHRPVVEELWRRSTAAGDFYRRVYEGYYCVGCEEFYASSELVDGCCAEHLTPAEWVAEENWFFRLSRYQSQIEDLIASGRLAIEPSIYRTEALAFVRAGLRDISVSRSRERARGWGIPVPGDPSQVIYVWWDALANYISALACGDDHRTWWLESDERVHVIGKGILRFHAVYWPALLLSAGEPPPTRIYVHPYLTANGHKLSKSTGNVVDPRDVIGQYGVDALRWWLLSDVPRLIDADYTAERLVRRHNADLAGGIANLVSRTVKLATPKTDDPPSPDVRVDGFELRQAADRIRDRIGELNRLIDRAQPWKTRDPRVLGDLVSQERRLAASLAPFAPESSARLLARLDGVDTGVLIPRL